MGPPVVQGAPAVPKMGVRARVSDWPQRREVWDAQPPPRYDSLVPSFLNGPPHSDSLLKKSLDLQTGSETRNSLCDLLSHSPSRSLLRMKRSNSEVTISDVGAEDLDPAAINPNTGATLRREYSSTSTLDRHGSSGKGLMSTLRVEQQPSAPPPLPEPLHLNASLSPSLQTAAQIARGDVVYVPGYDYVDASVFYSRDRERLPVQKKKPEKMEMSIFSRLRSQRSDGDYVQQQDVRFSLTSQKCFSHYDVQSVLFNISESSAHRPDLRHRKNTSTGASAASRRQEAADPEVDLDVLLVGCDELDTTANTISDDGDGKNSSLVLSCPFFLNEIGGETERKLGLTWANSATCSTTCSESALSSRCTNAGVSVLEVCRENQVFPQNLKNYDIEHIDLGAKYYLKYFYNRDHQNYFGVDENFGPVALSVRREKLEDEKDGTQYNYRIILRTSQPSTLRGSILEDSVPSSSKHGTARGLPLKEVLEFVVPELKIHSLRLATTSPRVPELLLQLDQQELSFQHKVGILLCRAGQSSEEEMYNNETSSPALDQFLDLLGHKVQLKGFTKYRAQLDTTGDSTGSHSVYTTFREFELMFHISTLLPYTANDTQQLLRKRHIGNDIVMVIFQEPDALPFSPKNIRSHFQHVFIIVRVHRPCSQHTCYSVAVSRCRDVPSFGPLIPAGRMFPASPAFRHFLLMKIINAQHAVHRSEKFVSMATRSRQEHLKELVENFITSTPVDSSSSVRLSFISLGGKKKERSTPRRHAHLQSGGALIWSVTARDFSHSVAVTCQLAVSNEMVVLIDEATRQVVFNCYCRDVIGWNAGHGGIKLFYEQGDCVMFSTREGNWEDVREITQRLQLVSRGGPAVEMSLRRNRLGQLGFHVNFEGVVADVEAHGFAWQAGLRPGCRLMEICRVAMVTLSHEQMIELLRTTTTVSVVVIPPHRDGTPRRSFSEIYRVPIIEYKLDADVTSCSFREALPTWHQVSAAPPTSRASSNQSAASEPEQQLIQIKQSSSFDMKKESRMPQEFDSPPVSLFCSSSSNQSTSSDPGPSVTRLSHAHCRGRSAGLPDWSSSEGGTQSRLERTRRTRSTETKWLLHPHPHHVTKVLRESQLSLTATESNNNQQRSGDKSCSSGSSSNMLSSTTLSSNTLSSSSSDDRHSEQQVLTYIEGALKESGKDSASCVPLAPPPVAGATLVLRDVRGEGPEGGLTRGINPITSAGHVTDSDLGDLSETCSLSSDSCRSRNSSERRLKISSSADSPEAFITCPRGSALEAGLSQSQEICPQEGAGPNRSERGSLLEEANRGDEDMLSFLLQTLTLRSRLKLLLTADLQFSSRPIRVFVRMMQSDVTAGEKSISRVSGVLPPSPWSSLTRTVSDDSLSRRTLSLTSSRRSLLMSDQLLLGDGGSATHHSTLPPRVSGRPWVTLQRSELCYSDSSLAERSKLAEGGRMPLPQVSSHLDWSHLVDAARAFEAAGVFSSSSLSDVHQLHQEKTESAALQDSDITAASLSGKVFQLEEILRQLQLDLLKEQQDKAALQQQVLNLRQDNLRLQEESQSAANQIRKFTAWMLHRRTLP